MSLPENPITRNETFLSVMAGQNDISTLPTDPENDTREQQYYRYIAINGGGGGDVTKEYVDEQDAKKADKITGGTAGNFAGLDNNGNITDSGKKASDFVGAVQVSALTETGNKIATITIDNVSTDIFSGDVTQTDMTRTTLYFNNWATTAADTIELVDSYKNYDALEFTLLRTANNDICPLEQIITVEAIDHVFEGKNVGLVLPFHSSDFVAYYATSDTLLTKVSSGGMVLAVAKIVGVKYAEEQLQIVSWQNGEDWQIVQMIQAAERGEINLSDYWSIGDERVIHLSAAGNGELFRNMEEQDATFVLMDTGENSGYKFADDTPVHFVVGVKDTVNDNCINKNQTNSGSWDASPMRAWLNSNFYSAVPSTIRPIFKQFKTVTAEEYNSSTLKTSIDYFALFAEKEVVGEIIKGNGTEGNALSQIEYYKTQQHKDKRKKGTTELSYWWWRSPVYLDDKRFVTYSSAGASTQLADYLRGVSPFGCI